MNTFLQSSESQRHGDEEPQRQRTFLKSPVPSNVQSMRRTSSKTEMPADTGTAAADAKPPEHSHQHDQGQAAGKAADSSSRKSGSRHSDDNDDRSSRGLTGSHGTPSDKTKVSSGSSKDADSQGQAPAERTEVTIDKGIVRENVETRPVTGGDIGKADQHGTHGHLSKVPERSQSVQEPDQLRSDKLRSAISSLQVAPEETPQPPRDAQPRKRMRPIGIIVLLMYIFAVIAAVLLVIVLFTRSGQTGAHTCATAVCSEYSSLLTSSINAFVSPCYSFTRFVCGSWERRQALSVREMLHQWAQDHMTSRVQAIQVPPSGQNSVQRAASVYSSCERVLSGYSDRLMDVKRALDGVGITWPYVQDNPDILRTLMATSLNLAWDVIAHVVPKRSGNRTTLMVNPGRQFYRIKEQATYSVSDAAFESYFTTLRKGFGHERSNISEVSLAETLELQKIVATSLVPNYDVRTVHPVPLTMPPVIGISNADWMIILEELGYNTTSEVKFVTTGSRFILPFFDIWERNGDRYAHLLLSWSTVQVAALFANKPLIVNYYGGNERVASARYGAFCMSLAYLFSHDALYGSHESKLDSGKARKSTERLIRTVVNAFQRRLSKWPHFRKDISVIPNWSELSNALLNFDNTREHSLVNRAPDMTDSLVENWSKLSLLPGSPVDDEIARSISSLQLSVPFPKEKTFRLTPLSVLFPVFDVRLHSAANYGGLGLQVASSLAWLLTTAYARGSRTNAVIGNLSVCVEESPSRGFYVDSPLSQAVAAGAVVDAYQAEATAKHMPSPLVGSYTGTQLFFMTQCFATCRAGDPGDSAGVCDLAMRQVKEFAQAFGCASGTPMNPIERCNVP